MAGLRILHADQSDAVPHLTETGFFDGESTLTPPSSIQRTGFGFALCPLQKFVWGSLVQVPKEWLGTRCAKSPNKSLLLFSRAWGRPAWVRGQLEQLPLLPLGDCRGDQHGARALRPRPG